VLKFSFSLTKLLISLGNRFLYLDQYSVLLRRISFFFLRKEQTFLFDNEKISFFLFLNMMR
jgi:hypothetical protein